MRSLTILVGCSSSGKDTVMRELINRYNFQPIISYTSRPMRECEEQGREYHFVSKEDFIDKKNNGEFIETREYNVAGGDTWFYGLPKRGIDFQNDVNYITILDLDGLIELQRYLLKSGEQNKLMSIYLDVSGRNRLMRSLSRESCSTDEQVNEMVRRYINDNANVLPGKFFCDYFFDNNTPKQIENIVRFIVGSVGQL